MSKKVKLKKNKIVPSVLYIYVSQYSIIYCHRNIILYFFKKSLISRVKIVSPLVTMTHIKDLSP